jgi:hypothetical protein
VTYELRDCPDCGESLSNKAVQRVIKRQVFDLPCIQQLFMDMYSLPISTASIASFTEKAYQRLKMRSLRDNI